MWGKAILALVIMSWAAGFFIGFTVALGIVTGAGLVLAILGLKREGLGLWGISILCTVDAASRVLLFTGGILRWNTLNYLLLGVALLSIASIFRIKNVHTRLLQIFIILLLVWLIFSPDFELGFLTVLNVAAYFGLLVYFARNNHSAEVWYWQGLIVGTLGAAGGLLFFLKKSGLPYVNPNAWSYFPLTALFGICLAISVTGRGRRSQMILTGLAALNVAWVFLSGSRGGLIVAAACIIYIAVTLRSVSQRIMYVVVGSVVAIVSMSEFTDQLDLAFHRLNKFMDVGARVESRTSGRSDLALGGWIIFQDSPLGVGTGGFATAWAKLGYKSNLSGFRYGQEMAAHSGWINTLVDNGFIGFLLLASFVASFAVRGWTRRQQGLFPVGMLVFAVFTLALLSTQFAAKGLWLLAAGVTMLMQSWASRPEGVRTPSQERSDKTPS